MSQPQHMQTFCNPIENFTQTSPFDTNRFLTLSTLSITSSLVPYINTTIGLIPDTVYGMFLCRGDMDTKSCSECVQAATIQIATSCSLNKRAVIYYQECMVRYSNVNFFSELETVPRTVLFSARPAPNQNRFNQTLSDKFEQLILKVSSSSLIPYFVKEQERVTELEGSYELESMVQCTPDLDLSSCTVCLRDAFLRVSTCCGSPSSAQIFTPKCLVRYRTSVSLSSAPPPS
ncbi:unnamed protein product [Arabis nemorensis]|uniref:Gnk2-homologous domain-containing protein n=1 Tax=Arabis nemorensis TaxID=586526 RepID=A0A565B5M3_9BRAS|nr:unnamed protein product [Arabis nemorensis]